MPRLFLLSFLLGLTACSTSPTLGPTSPALAPLLETPPQTVEASPQTELSAAGSYQLSVEQRRIVETQIARFLKDTESASFGIINAAKAKGTPGLVILCGWLNAKNSSTGAYTGEQPFYGMYLPKAGTAGARQIGTTETGVRGVQKHCTDNGIPLPGLPMKT